jgi:hypothetical protein
VETAEKLEAIGIRGQAADIRRPDELEKLGGPYDWVVNTVSSNRAGIGGYQQVYVDGTRNLDRLACVKWCR